jgi:F-type H+-transporting ATPase subunit b
MAAVLALGLPAGVLAAEAGAPWRPLYDTLMLWVNFAILVAVLVKFLRRPFKDFVVDYRDSVARDLEKLEGDRQKAADAVLAFRDTLEDRRRQSEAFRRRMTARGEREFLELVDEARRQSRRLLDKARHQAEHRMREARSAIRRDIVEAAMAHALEELPRHLGPETQQLWVDRFIAAMAPPPR